DVADSQEPTQTATKDDPDVEWTGLVPGTTYTITESSGLNATGRLCTLELPPGGPSRVPHGGPPIVPTEVEITPGLGDHLVCTFFNEGPPVLVIDKMTNGAAGGPFDFTVTTTDLPNPP